MKAVLYIRVSTDKQDAENQALQLREYCARAGHEVVYEYVDIISGKETSRPAYDRMYEDARKLRFEMLVFWDLSRFSRAGTLHTLQRLKELDNLGIKWHSYQDSYLSSVGDFKDVVISIMATLAKVEREKISERTKAGLARAIAQGKRPGRKKGQKDTKPRRRKGYYDNRNRRASKIGGVDGFKSMDVVSDIQTNARFSPLPDKVARRWYCVSGSCAQGSWYGVPNDCPTCKRVGRKTPIEKKEDGGS